MQDIRYACRTLSRNRGFAAAAICTLALGIGANTAIFDVISGVLQRPLPYPESEAAKSRCGTDATHRRILVVFLPGLP